MRRPLSLALAAAAVLVAGACSTSPCQRLGERLCTCTGLPSDLCTQQVETQLNALKPSLDALDECQKLLDSCNAPPDTVFCEWINTRDGKLACGLAPEVVTTTL